jgi:hypothetical protein
MIYGTRLHCFPVSVIASLPSGRIQDLNQQPLTSADITIAQYLLQPRYALLNHYLSVFVLTSMRKYIFEVPIY